MTESEQDILVESRRRAQRILTESREKAQRVLDEAHAEAIALLLEQQDEAAQLLLDQHDDAIADREQAVSDSHEFDEPKRAALIVDHDRSAESLLEKQQLAAQKLVAAQQQVAARLDHAVACASSDILMTGQRNAAAVLLEARMRVLDRRP